MRELAPLMAGRRASIVDTSSGLGLAGNELLKQSDCEGSALKRAGFRRAIPSRGHAREVANSRSTRPAVLSTRKTLKLKPRQPAPCGRAM